MKIGKSLGVLTKEIEEQHSPVNVGHQARKAKSDQLRKRHTAMADAVKHEVQRRSTFTRTASHDQATVEEQHQEPEKSQASAQVRAKKPRTRAPTTAAGKALEDGDQERHMQSQTSNGTNTIVPEPPLNAGLECYTLERAQSKLIKSVTTQPADNNNRDLKSPTPCGDPATRQ